MGAGGPRGTAQTPCPFLWPEPSPASHRRRLHPCLSPEGWTGLADLIPSFNLASWPHCNLQPGQACGTTTSGTRELCPMSRPTPPFTGLLTPGPQGSRLPLPRGMKGGPEGHSRTLPSPLLHPPFLAYFLILFPYLLVLPQAGTPSSSAGSK